MISLFQSIWYGRQFRNLAFTENELKRQMVRSALFVIVIFVVHVIAMMAFEGMAAGDALWLTVTTATTTRD